MKASLITLLSLCLLGLLKRSGADKLISPCPDSVEDDRTPVKEAIKAMGNAAQDTPLGEMPATEYVSPHPITDETKFPTVIYAVLPARPCMFCGRTDVPTFLEPPVCTLCFHQECCA